MTKYLLAHDLGTSGNKATLFSDEGKLVASRTVSYPTNYFNRVWAEQNPNDWWVAVCDSTNRLLADSGIDPAEIAVVALSGQMMGSTCVDRGGEPLRPSIIYCDQRSEKETAAILANISMQEAYDIVGHRVAAVYGLPKLMWVKNNEPDIFRKTYKTLCAKDYINFKLTGVFATDYSDASSTNAFDLGTLQWSETVLQAAKMDAALYPEAFPSTYVLGEVTSAAAAATGLKVGTPVCCGGGDGSCAAVGVGSVKPGKTYNYVGSSGWIGLTVKEPIVDPSMRTMTWAHCVPGYYHPTGSVQTAGSAYHWAREQLGEAEVLEAQRTGRNPYELLDAMVHETPIGANGLIFLPYLLGERSPRWNPNARGAFIGLTLTSRRSDMVRAVMEGVSYNLGMIVDIFRRHVPIDEVTVIGGGAKGRVWLQMMADIYGVPVHRPNCLEEATSMGAAVVGGVGVGLFKDFEVVERFFRIEETFEPDPEARRKYDKIKPLFDRAYLSLEGLFDELAAI